MIPKVLTPLEQLLEGFVFEKINIGHSGAGVWRCTRDLETWFVKADQNTQAIRAEAERLTWFGHQALPVPELVAHLEHDRTAFLVTQALQGTDASQSLEPRETVVALAQSLKMLHSTNIGTCPFDRRLEVVLPQAQHNLERGEVDETDFDDKRLGIPAAVLLEQLHQTRPKHEDLVLTHGDFCLPNIILQGNRVTGFIDLGRAGMADRHQDLALMIRSFEHELNPHFHGLSNVFIEAYGMTLDPDKLEYYQMLDEFF